jgi:four helix bundle protein
MLTHHRLNVYEKALALGANAQELSASWGRRHAIVEHFRRASESIVLNIAEGARLVSGPDKARTLDYALGSTLECAACLDIARIKGRLSHQRSLTEKRRFLEITRMLIGLRKAWLQCDGMSEEPSPYQAEPSTPGLEILFHHESLDVYQVGLDFMRWFVGLPGGRELTDRLCREADKSATSVVLNVAEGNGRYSELDHRRFLEIAGASAVKAAVYLDLYPQKALPARLETTHGGELLSRVVAMLNRFF